MNLYLIGFRGSGKSTVAPLLAGALGWKSSDSDEETVILTGRTIAEIFADDGETGFRQWETTVIQGLAQQQEHVISLGGGAPMIAENRVAIKRSGKTVLLTASAEKLWQRISDDGATQQLRPQLTDLDGFAEVKKLLEQRADVYNECADYTIDTTVMSPEEIADNIANWWDPVDT